MLTTRPHLTTLRPSPTTISYTVSTASRRETLRSKLFHHILLSLRIILGLATLAVLLAKSLDDFHYMLNSWLEYIDKAPWSHVGPLSFASFFLVFRRFHTGMLAVSFTLSSHISVAALVCYLHLLAQMLKYLVL